MFEKGSFINDRYEVLGRIGSGGTSHVFLVADRHIGRSLAMKVLDRKRFGALRFAKSEIETLRSVRYPLFPAIHDAFCDDRHIYILSEYVKGVSLSDMIREGGLSKDRSLYIAGRICEALIYLHGLTRPMLYLDLKPDNIIVSEDGLPHLIDFGIAGWLAAKHIPVGTAGYSPPEQYDPDEGMDERTDIFALGMTYYSIRCARPPDPDADKALYDIRHSKVLGLSERSFLAGCCAPAKEDRYRSSREVLKHIRHIRQIPERIKKNLVISAVAGGAALLALYAGKALARTVRQNEAASDLVAKATGYMEDGEYTREGIGIIKACINSGTLSPECEQEFIFEVAVNSMLVAGDYKTAAVYFARLDPREYPETEDYLRLCELQTGFEYDPEEAAEVTGRLFAETVKRAPSKMKYENMIFIAGCFENYDPDPYQGALKALSVLRMEKRELEELEEQGASSGFGDMNAMQNRLDELIDVRKRRIDMRRKMIGDKDEEQER